MPLFILVRYLSAARATRFPKAAASHSQRWQVCSGHYGRWYFSIMSLSAQLIADLAHGTAYSFAIGPIPLSPFSVPGSIRSGTMMAASSMSACLDEVSLSRHPAEIRPKAFTRACKATPVDAAVATSSAFT